MNNNPFISELHDIGKLVGESLKDQIKAQYGTSWTGHNLHELDLSKISITKPTCASWWGLYHHVSSFNQIDINQWNEIPKEFRSDLFLLKIADGLSTSISRSVRKKPKGSKEQEGILKLWNKQFYALKSNFQSFTGFKTIQDLENLFNEMDKFSSGEEFLLKYKEYLILKAEDESFPNTLTSLYSHIVLTGKIYHFLQKRVNIQKEPDSSISILYDNEKVNSIPQAQGTYLNNILNEIQKNKGKNPTNNNLSAIRNDPGRWRIQFLFCRIIFPNSMARLHDLNIYQKIQELLTELNQTYPNEILLMNSDNIFMILAPNDDPNIIFKDFLNWGLRVDIQRTFTDLGLMTSNLDRFVLKARKDNDIPLLDIFKTRNIRVEKKILVPLTKVSISGQICEICQQEVGIECYTKENTCEWICTKCQNIRNMGEPFTEYGNVWDQEKTRVCWFKIKLDQVKLLDWINSEFEKCIINNGITWDQEIAASFRPLGLQMDFTKDYEIFIDELYQNCIKNEEFHYPIQNMKEFGVFKFNPEKMRFFINTFTKLYSQFFQDCIGDKKCPISLSMSIANIKFPLREHWRYLEQDQENQRFFFNIRYNNVFEDQFTFGEIDVIMQKIFNSTNDGQKSQRYLHQLSMRRMKLKSDLLMSMSLIEEKFNHPELFELFKGGINPLKLVNLYTILND